MTRGTATLGGMGHTRELSGWFGEGGMGQTLVFGAGLEGVGRSMIDGMVACLKE